MNKINNRNTIIIIAAILIVTFAAGIIGWSIHHKRQQALLTELKMRNDSIEGVQRELMRIEQLRKDSIAYEDSMRFTAEVLITKITMIDEKWKHYGQYIHKNWKKRLENLGFKEGKKKLVAQDLGEYDYELYDIYTFPYSRTVNGRTITVEPKFTHYKRQQDGTWISDKYKRFEFIDNSHLGSSFNIIFENLSDMEIFESSLRELGLSKHQEIPSEWNEYSKRIYLESEPSSLDKDKENMPCCPHVRCYVEGNEISIYNDVDC